MGLMRQSFGFTALSTSNARFHHAATNSHQIMDISASALSAFTIPDDLDILLDSPLLTTSMSSLLLSMSTRTLFSTLLDPNVKAEEALTDISHLALDFTSLLNSSTLLSALMDPNVEAEVLTDISHIALDFTSLLNSSKALLKKTSVLGRVLIIFADYIPDHSIHPEELVIQLFMLGLAIKNLTRSLEK